MVGQLEVQNSVGEYSSLSDNWLLSTRSASFARNFHADSRHADNLCMLRGGSPRKHTFANQTLTQVFAENCEYLANLVAAGGACTSMSIFVSSHFYWENFGPLPEPCGRRGRAE